MSVEVHDVPERHHYEAVIDGQHAGLLAYRQRDGGERVLVHTEVDGAFEGRGVGGALARHALDAARTSGQRVAVQCEFVRGWIDRHPEYEDVVAPT